MTATDTAREMAITAAHGASEKLAQNIVIIDVSDRLAITDMFVVASAGSDRQVGAIVDSVEEQLRAAGYKPARREGERDGRWVLLDYIDIVVHVQHNEERAFYALDRLWKDCPTFGYHEDENGANLTEADLVAHPAVPTPPAADDAPDADAPAEDPPAEGAR